MHEYLPKCVELVQIHAEAALEIVFGHQGGKNEFVHVFRKDLVSLIWMVPLKYDQID